jgi:hypothetical protein
MEILRDGTRRRRKGCQQETGGVPYYYPEEAYLDDVTTFARSNSYQWDNVGGDTSLTFQVVKVGGTIHFYKDSETLSANKKSFTISLYDFATTGDVVDVIENPVTFTSHQGILFASAKYVHPMYITYDPVNDSVSVTPIEVRVRDLAGVPDEVPINIKPTTLTAEHEYNLVNRGWSQGTNSPSGYGYLKFFADTGAYPAKNMIYWKGYSKKAEASTNISSSVYNPADWSKSYSSAKLEAEVFGSSDAPQGHLLLNPFDTSYAQVGSGVGAQNVTAVTAVNALVGGVKYIRVTLTVPSAHGLSINDPVEVTGGTISYTYKGGTHAGSFALTGVHEVSSVLSTTSITVLIRDTDNTYNRIYDLLYEVVPPKPEWITWTGPTTMGSDPVTNTLTGVVTDTRPTAVEMFAGRIWYGGFGGTQFADTVMFSQLVMNSATDYEKYGRCYQAGDPTDEFRAMVVPTDGGTVQIPGLSGVKDMVAVQNAIVIFADSGVYEVSGGGAPFSANNFSVRQITDAGAWSAAGIASTEFGLVYTSPRGVYALTPDGQSGRMSAVPIVDDNIKTLWNAIPDIYQRYAQLVYDYALQNLYLAYTDDSRPASSVLHYDSALVYTLRSKAWYRLRFPMMAPESFETIRCLLVTKSGDGANNNKKVKFITAFADISGYGVKVHDLDHTTFMDGFGVGGEVLPYIITAYDGVGGEDVPSDFGHKRQATTIHVYSKRTETGVDGTGAPVNTSSILLEPRWDFTDTNATGRASTPQQCYRKPNLFLGDPTEDGQPVIISRLKLRGRGKSLHLKFYGEAGKDMHLLGYSIHYKIGRGV